MDLETAKIMSELSGKQVNLEALKNGLKSGKFVEPDLNELKNKVLDMDVHSTKQIMMFTSYKRGGSSLPELQLQINEFLQQTEYDIIDIKFSVQRNFLLGSTSGEFEENSYAMVIYEI